MRAILLVALALMSLSIQAKIYPKQVISPPVTMECQILFSPGSHINTEIVKQIDATNESLIVVIYTFTSAPIGNAVIRAHQRGVDVIVLIDPGYATGRGSAVPSLLAAGIPVYKDLAHAIMHDKFIISDGQKVQTGSYNYTNNAEYNNAENALFCNSSALAAIYIREFDLLMKQAARIPN